MGAQCSRLRPPGCSRAGLLASGTRRGRRPEGAPVAAGADLMTPTRQIEAAPRLDEIRSAVRALLESSPAYGRLEPADRRRLAQGMVRICYTAAQLKHDSGTLEENAAGQQRRPALAMTPAPGGGSPASPHTPPS